MIVFAPAEPAFAIRVLVILAAVFAIGIGAGYLLGRKPRVRKPPPAATEYLGVPASERYKQALDTWRFASSLRLQLLTTWLAVYIGLAVVFAWLWNAPDFKIFAFYVPIIAIIATVLFWFVDDRNGDAIHASKRAIQAMEASDRLPTDQRIIEQSEDQGFTHANATLIFALLMGLLFTGAAIHVFFRLLP